MKRILAQSAANNQILVRYTRTHTSNKTRTLGDKTKERDREHLAKVAQKAEDLGQLIRKSCCESTHINYVYPVVDKRGHARTGISVFPSRTNVLGGSTVRLPVCLLKRTIEYYDYDSLQVVQSNYSELAQQCQALLDIIKKSQQCRPKHASYGRVQSVKRFTAAAKQCILEAGAVVDKHTERSCQRELTLTIPGSGWEIYDVVSRWSGWIINRMTQVIRRLEQEGYELYWFFVWEHQKRGALHQHWCVASHESPEFTHNICRLLLAKWYQLLEELSVKTGIDLFKKKGSFGTWRHSPKKWQYNIAPIRKGVARYFSKYCSKNSETSKYNSRRRTAKARLKANDSDRSCKRPVYSFCPSRYWGCNSRIKKLRSDYRVTVSLDVPSRQEGDYISKTISKWCSLLSDTTEEVSRTFKVVCPETGHVFSEGYEWRCWVSPSALETLIAILRAFKVYGLRRLDAVAAVCDFDELISSLLHPCNSLGV